MLWAVTSRAHIPAFPILWGIWGLFPHFGLSQILQTLNYLGGICSSQIWLMGSKSLEKRGDRMRHSQCNSSLLLREMTPVLHFLPPMHLITSTCLPCARPAFPQGKWSNKCYSWWWESHRSMWPQQKWAGCRVQHQFSPSYRNTHFKWKYHGCSCTLQGNRYQKRGPSCSLSTLFPALSQSNSLSQQKVNQVKTSTQKMCFPLVNWTGYSQGTKAAETQPAPHRSNKLWH